MSDQNEMEERALGALALSVDVVTPPPALRERILGTARQDAEVVPLRSPRSRIGGVRVPLGAVAAMVFVALVAGLVAGDVLGRGGATQIVPPAQSTRFDLTGHGPMSRVSATVLDVKAEGIAIATFSSLPELPPGKVYELWLITAANKVDAAGVFVPDANGSQTVVIARALLGYKTMAVTIEAGPSGVSAPTQDPQIYGTVT